MVVFVSTAVTHRLLCGMTCLRELGILVVVQLPGKFEPWRQGDPRRGFTRVVENVAAWIEVQDGTSRFPIEITVKVWSGITRREVGQTSRCSIPQDRSHPCPTKKALMTEGRQGLRCSLLMLTRQELRPDDPVG